MQSDLIIAFILYVYVGRWIIMCFAIREKLGSICVWILSILFSFNLFIYRFMAMDLYKITELMYR